MQDNGQRNLCYKISHCPSAKSSQKCTYSVGGEDDDLANTAVESLGCLVGTLLCDSVSNCSRDSKSSLWPKRTQLAVVGSLLHEIQNLLLHVRRGNGEGGGVV